MRNTVLIISTVATGMVIPNVAFGQTFSGDVGVSSQYVDRDDFVLTDTPVVQASLEAQITDNCKLDAWGNHALDKNMGGELDLGGGCDFKLNESVTVSVEAEREFLAEMPDITTVSGSITAGAFDLSVKHYFWDKNPDATRIEAGYTLEPAKKFTAHPAVVYETGFGEGDIVLGVLDLKYDLNDRMSVNASVYTPISKEAGDERTTRATVGITYTF